MTNILKDVVTSEQDSTVKTVFTEDINLVNEYEVRMTYYAQFDFGSYYGRYIDSFSYKLKISGTNYQPKFSSAFQDSEVFLNETLIYTFPSFSDQNEFDTLALYCFMSDLSEIPDWITFDNSTRRMEVYTEELQNVGFWTFKAIL